MAADMLECPRCGSMGRVPDGASQTGASPVVRSWRRSKTGLAISIVVFVAGTALVVLMVARPRWIQSLRSMPDGTEIAAEGPRSSGGTAGVRAVLPYDFKGDQLGMSIDDFKAKYHRIAQDGLTELPQFNEYEDWHAAAGITAGTLTTYFENEDRSPYAPTLVGVPVHYHSYAFIDGRLYAMWFAFAQERVSVVLEALIATYGEPSSSMTEEVQNAFGATFPNTVVRWDNGVSAIVLTERSSDLNTSTLYFVQHDLAELADSRRPKPRL
ncbi:MAG: hypothetical protein KJZ69_09590 [Phycisphaerales bacterium]|nr:hypothetical protein [Phycisphaerales bacterium]